uniref:Uncharacterized protein n=1 Tax=Caenorhabditis japonica TaxID=281687 RepID=A0A8R1E1F9_CAEJA
MFCTETLGFLFRLSSLILWLIGAISHLSVLAFIMRIFKNYHLFFIIFYTMMVTTRLLSASLKCTGYLLILTQGKVPRAIDDALWVAKFSTEATALACLIERGYATLYATIYENSRRGSLILICAIVSTISCGLAFFESVGEVGRKMNAASCGAFIAVATFILMLINRKLVAKSKPNCPANLSKRYQLAENVKALR